MTKEQFINAMGDIDDKFIKKIHCSCEEQCEFDPNDDKPQIMRPASVHSSIWKFAVSAAAVVVLAAGVFAVLKLNGTPSVDPGGVITDSGSDISEPESESSVSSAESSVPDSSLSENEPESSVDEYNYKMEHRYDNIVKGRYVYGETEIPDVHYESANEEGCVTHIIWSDEWQYTGLESMVFETHTFGEYTYRLVGRYVRTDKEYYAGRIFGDFEVEVEKDSVREYILGFNNDLSSGDGGALYQPENLIFSDKIGCYLDFYDMEYPVITLRYYLDENNPNRNVTRIVDFAVLKDGEWLYGFVGHCDPGCGVYLGSSQGDGKQPNIVNTEACRCRAALFSADKFIMEDKKTLIDEEANIRYTFNFADELPFELYTAEKISD